MVDVYELIKLSKEIRQKHIDLASSCIERGGKSTNHKGVLSQYLNTNIPHGTRILLCHACHNGKCSNPNHLYWGTPSENRLDALSSGIMIIQKKKKTITDETRQKISNTLKGRPSNNKLGKNGATTGNRAFKYKKYKRKIKQMWITNGRFSTRVPFNSEMPAGWVAGITRKY